MSVDNVIPIAAAAEFRKLMSEYSDAGWHVDHARFEIDVAGGAALYLCDMESGQIMLVTLKGGALRKLAAEAKRHAYPFEEACNCFGTIYGDFVTGRAQLAGESKNDLAIAAGLYIVGTLSYQVAVEDPRFTLPQFLVIRMPNVETGGHLLRPVPLLKESPMRPEELVVVVNDTLLRDREKHPTRFGFSQVVPFTLKSKL